MHPEVSSKQLWAFWGKGYQLLEQSFNRSLVGPICIFNNLSFTQQFRYKSRVYRQPNVDEKQIAKLHTKVRLTESLFCYRSAIDAAFLPLHSSSTLFWNYGKHCPPGDKLKSWNEQLNRQRDSRKRCHSTAHLSLTVDWPLESAVWKHHSNDCFTPKVLPK